MIKFLKTRNVASPEREKGNAGFDFFCPVFDADFMSTCKAEGEKNPKAACEIKSDSDGDYIELAPHKRVSIPSGIKCRIELGAPLSAYGLGIELKVENKSGVATKKGLDIGASIVDENYQGEVHISLTNASDETVKIRPGDKIVQLVPYVYVNSEFDVVDVKDVTEEQFYKDFKWNNRGSGWAGSTGTHA